MHTTTPEFLAALAAGFGEPTVLRGRAAIGEDEMVMLRASKRGWREHDATFFIFGPDARLALIRKPGFPPASGAPRVVG